MKRPGCRALLALFFGFFLYIYQAGAQTSSWDQTWGSQKAFIENKGQFGPAGHSDTKSEAVLYAIDDDGTFVGFCKSTIHYSFLERKPSARKESHEHFRNEREWLKEEKEEQKAQLKKDEVTCSWDGADQNAELVAGEETDNYYSYSVRTGARSDQVNHIRGFKKLTYKNLPTVLII